MIEDNIHQSEDEELKFNFVNNEEEKRFYSILDEVINDRWWCIWHEIDYVNPNIKLVAQRLYNDMFSERNK